jgi:hypothetical protein
VTKRRNNGYRFGRSYHVLVDPWHAACRTKGKLLLGCEEEMFDGDPKKFDTRATRRGMVACEKCMRLLEKDSNLDRSGAARR